MKTHCNSGHPRTPENLYKDGKCRLCAREVKRLWRLSNPELALARDRARYLRNKDAKQASTRKWAIGNPDKRRKYEEKYRKNNSEKLRARARLSYALNPGKVNDSAKKYRLKNLSQTNARIKAWELRNPGRKQARVRKAQALKINRIPSWLTREQLGEIQSFYVESAALTKTTGIEHHVDHIVPLSGASVSGLHVPWNLQILTQHENLTKANKFELQVTI